MAINRGRKKIDRFNAIIDNVYQAFFTVKVDTINQQNVQTFSYFDVLCGDVEIVKSSELKFINFAKILDFCRKLYNND
jgi:uncharacterized protein Veg